MSEHCADKDGWRVQVAVSPSLDAGVRITTRSGRQITAQVAGLEGLVKAGYEVVVDAELVVGDGSACRSTAWRRRWLGAATPSP